MAGSILLTCDQHILQGIKRGGQQPVVIVISKNDSYLRPSTLSSSVSGSWKDLHSRNNMQLQTEQLPACSHWSLEMRRRLHHSIWHLLPGLHRWRWIGGWRWLGSRPWSFSWKEGCVKSSQKLQSCPWHKWRPQTQPWGTDPLSQLQPRCTLWLSSQLDRRTESHLNQTWLRAHII